MISGLITIATFISVILFPWPLTALLAVASSLSVPLLPLAAGLFADTLYYSPQANFLPVFTIFGAVISSITIFVRSRLSARII